MKKMSVFLLIASLAISATAVQAKDHKNGKADFFSIKKEHIVCDKKNCWSSQSKVKADQAKNKKHWLKKFENKFKKFKKDKKPKNNGLPTPIAAVPEINTGGAAMALLLAAALVLTAREKRKRSAF